MSNIRRERLQGQLIREISDIIQNKLRDPRRGWMNVTSVEMSIDLRYAKVFVSFLGGEDQVDQGLKVLRGAASYMRVELARRLRVRHCPELNFQVDRGLEISQKVFDILDSLDIPEADESNGEDLEEGL
ncbi:MAG: 30S ribosome-binding factor RbfA [Candidatus Eisenbacteria bacterium]|uniref:Ribosome-binding factor A n=1 Tax=Eiseniibacteriota bacterium TaxID=2212470 RepID=A0A948RTA7_UNCEI|nr:30S ribosome-binding factor RbfA [Candidatus Eisenbacteria bacterium]MBU1951195.1 30S ribosome-binding factor RbfA [Candidatus Eisenbacteria bacterium]MBU2690618.1 30S ribosome-binding factor RbfA [Candidatus Eisenbacteria bacterium]